jgi:TatD DNase family protein
MDLYWDKTHLKEQQFAFENNSVSQAVQIAIVIHGRDAFDEIFAILRRSQ